MMRNFILAVALAFIVSACASQPNRMTTAYVSPQKYAGYNCAQISEELEVMTPRMDELYYALKLKADDDEVQTILGFLFPPTWTALEGGDGPMAGEYARLKGEEGALNDQWRQKKCGKA